MSFKVLAIEPPPAGATLRRVSYIARTVRYEWTVDGWTRYAPAFTATAQEWERAHD